MRNIDYGEEKEKKEKKRVANQPPERKATAAPTLMPKGAQYLESKSEIEQHLKMIYLWNSKSRKHSKRIQRQSKLGLSSAKLSRDKFGCLEVFFEVVSKDNLK